MKKKIVSKRWSMTCEAVLQHDNHKSEIKESLIIVIHLNNSRSIMGLHKAERRNRAILSRLLSVQSYWILTFFATDTAIDECAKHRAHNRRYPEKPKL